MFPYTEPVTHHEVVEFMNRHGARTRTTVPRTGDVTPGYGTRPWAQPPAAISFYAPNFQPQGPLVHYVIPPRQRGQERVQQRWMNVVYLAVGKELDLYDTMRSMVVVNDLKDRDCLLLEKVGDYLVRSGFKRGITANTVMLFTAYVTTSVGVTSENSLAFLRQVATVASMQHLTSAQQQECIDRRVPLEELLLFGGKKVPYPLIKDLYPLPGEQPVFV